MVTQVLRAPERLAYGFTGGPEFDTGISTLPSKKEKRNRRRDAVWKWAGTYGAKTQAEINEIRGHFMSVSGRWGSFVFKDWMDFEVKVTEGVADELTSTTFQLAKAYTYGSVESRRAIRRPLSAGFSIRVNGTPLSGGAYSLDTSTGIVTIAAAPDAEDITWSGQFDCLVRYDTDSMGQQIVNKHASDGYIYTWDQVPYVEVKA